MDDRTLLEMAAKAHGSVLFHKFMNYAILQTGHEKDGDPVVPWDPLNDDGDALRLLVKLRFGITDIAPRDAPEIAEAPPSAALWGMVEIWRESDEDPIYIEWYKAGSDRFAATRRAIVRAAAEIGSRVSAPGAVEGGQ